ncbi:hypothetical protein D3C76_1591470 [compost metagenome]
MPFAAFLAVGMARLFLVAMALLAMLIVASLAAGCRSEVTGPGEAADAEHSDGGDQDGDLACIVHCHSQGIDSIVQGCADPPSASR